MSSREKIKSFGEAAGTVALGLFIILLITILLLLSGIDGSEDSVSSITEESTDTNTNNVDASDVLIMENFFKKANN